MQNEQVAWKEKFIGKIVSNLIPITLFILIFGLIFEVSLYHSRQLIEKAQYKKYLEQKRLENEQTRLEIKQRQIEEKRKNWEENGDSVIEEIESIIAELQFAKARQKIAHYKQQTDDPRLDALQEKVATKAAEIKAIWNPSKISGQIELRNPGYSSSSQEEPVSDYNNTELVIKCNDGLMEVFVDLKSKVLNLNDASYRLGHSSPRTDHLSLGDDGSSLTWPPGMTSLRLAQEMLENDRFFVSFAGQDNKLLTTTFDLKGLKLYLPNLEQVCGADSLATRRQQRAVTLDKLVVMLNDDNPATRLHIYETVMQDDDQDAREIALKQAISGSDDRLRLAALREIFMELKRLQVTVNLPADPNPTQSWLHQEWKELELFSISFDETNNTLSGKFKTEALQNSKNKFEGKLNPDGISLKLLRGTIVDAHICDLKTDVVSSKSLSGQMECRLDRSLMNRIEGSSSTASLPVTVNLPQN